MITRYYCTEKRGITFKESSTTIPETDERVRAFFEFDLNDKSLEMTFTEDGLPLVKRYALDANGNRYVNYLSTPDTDGVYQPDTAKEAEATKQAQEQYFEQLVQNHLDTEAQALGYDNVLSACSYAGYTNPFQAEGQSFVAWRGDVWQHCYQVLADVEAGTRAVPTDAELISELPVRS